MEEAAAVAKRIRNSMSVELKADGTIVTTADRMVEEFLRRELGKAWPGTSVWGEEFGRDDPSADGIWLIDPIDGTSNFAFGSPLWGISVALVVGARIELGAVSLPDLGETYLAEFGHGSFANGAAMPPIPPGPILAHQLVSYNDSLLKRRSGGGMPGKMRCAGAFVVDGMFTARQRYRGLIGMNEYLYDAAASILVNTELGADVRWASGEPLDVEDLVGGRRMDAPWIIFPANSGFSLFDEE